jgi:phage-related protein
VGSAYRELIALPRQVRQAAGDNLRLVQQGEMPLDWKWMEQVGPGACEIRVRSAEHGEVQHRVIYVAKFPEAVYVLHVFEKKSQRTSPHNLEVAAARYRQMLRQRSLLERSGKGSS